MSELSTDLGLMEAGIMASLMAVENGFLANLMAAETEQAGLRESVTTQIAEEVGACKAASEDGAEKLRLEVQTSLGAFRSEFHETVVRQMGSRISSAEAAFNSQVAAMEARISEAASRTELKTQVRCSISPLLSQQPRSSQPQHACTCADWLAQAGCGRAQGCRADDRPGGGPGERNGLPTASVAVSYTHLTLPTKA